MTGEFLLENVPPITGYEHADIFLDALSIGLCYQDPELPKRLEFGVYDTLSGFTGRGWLIGFDEAAYYWERYGVNNLRSDFACSSLEAYLSQCDTMLDAFRFVERTPEFLWNQACEVPLGPAQAAGFPAIAEATDAPGTREYVGHHLESRGCPVIALLHLPDVGQVDMTLLTGYEGGGDVVLGRSLLQGPRTDNSGPFGYFRLPDWERHVLALIGIGGEAKTEWEKHPCFIATENGLKCGRSYSEGTRHYGLAAYDAWERALLDDECIDGVDDETLAPRLQYHSAVAGSTACQRCFTAIPGCDEAPSMGVVGGLVRRARSGALMVHGLMWDVWQAVGGYWRMQPGDSQRRAGWEGSEELARFRDRSVRERAVAAIRRARKTDEESLRDLADAKDDWERCISHGTAHPCPCMGPTPCARV
jgi:hypothetical protein